MAAVLIEHPRHGRMHVYTPEDLRRHEALGWRPVLSIIKHKDSGVEYEDNVVTLRRGRGRPRKQG